MMVELLENRPGTSRSGKHSMLPARFNTVDFSNRRRLRDMIEHSVVRAFDVPECELRASTRWPQKVARARQVAMYLAHVSCGLSLTEVGHVFARDRTTVAHACSVIEDRRDDKTFDCILEMLERVALSNIYPRRLPAPFVRDGVL